MLVTETLETTAQTLKADLAWFKAFTLAERAELINSLNLTVDEATAEKLLERWRSLPAFKNTELFKLRLAEINLSEADFGRLLAAPAATFVSQSATPPDWIKEIEQGLANESNQLDLPISPNLAYPELAAFLGLAKPFIQTHRVKLERGIQQLIARYKVCPFDSNSITEIVLEGLDRTLIELLTPTMVLELNVARVKNLLQGATSTERFNHFIELLQGDYGRTILEEYPVLVRHLNATIKNWVDYALEILGHLCSDWSELIPTFTPNNPAGLLSRIKTGKGDFHRQGRTVTIIEFSSGLQLVYKPKSLCLDAHFQQLLTWLNQHGWTPTFQTLTILDRGSYGWVEYVETAPCTTATEVERFYRRQGGYLALLYALAATDFHAENIIARGEQPLLIDLETLFQPAFNRADSSTTVTTEDIVQRDKIYSVINTGLLPTKIFSGKNSEGIEASGLGGDDGQALPQPLAQWEKVGTDEMHLVLKDGTFPSAKNRPTLNGLRVNAYDYVEIIADGFNCLYHLLMQHRAELLAANGPIQKFENDVIRVVLRSTYFYVLLQQHSFQANYLRDACDRDRLFDKLWNGVKLKHWLVRAVSAERKDLHEGDIPFFTSRVSSPDVYTSQDEIIPNLLPESGMAFVRRRIEQLGETDLNRQLWYIRASLMAFANRNENRQNRVYKLEDMLTETVANRSAYLAAACQVGDRLLELALKNGQEATWLGLLQDSFDHWSLGPLRLTLYDGLPGVALFLAYLGEITGEAKYTEAAQAACRSMQQQIAPSWEHLKIVGLFEGWAGVIYTLNHLGVLWGNPELLVEAVELVEPLLPLIETDQTLDLISGVSGCAEVLMGLYRTWAQNSVLAAAMRCGERLVATVESQEIGMAWHTPMPVSQPAVGFGRGSTGMGLALLHLAELTRNERFRQVGLASLAYERSVFQPDAGNWPDFRTTYKDKLAPGVYRYGTAWCHGAPGIGLARLALLQYQDSPELRTDIEMALLNTVKRGFGSNHSLCHGDFGNIDLLVEATHKLNDPRWQMELNRIGSALLNSIKKYGWLCSTPLGVETPGLMVGLAGIGYGLLRLANPDLVPSVLTVEPPRRHFKSSRTQ